MLTNRQNTVAAAVFSAEDCTNQKQFKHNSNTVQIQVYFDKSDGSSATVDRPSVCPSLTKSTKKQKKIKKSGSVETGALAMFFCFFSWTASNLKGFDRTGNPGVPCFMCWSKDILIGKLTWVRFVPTPRFQVSLNSFFVACLALTDVQHSSGFRFLCRGRSWRYRSLKWPRLHFMKFIGSSTCVDFRPNSSDLSKHGSKL